jgi:3-hydroxy-9,10-secoandrosta-1,3,5(10)-triene-9,17-dione monooxygenase reductase component
MTVSDELKQTVGRAIGRIPSGVFVLSARADGPAGAALVSWVQQAAFDPPSISVALAKERAIGQIIRSTERFALSVLGQPDAGLMKRFARGVPHGEDAFAGLNVIQTPSTLPVLADALAYLDCRLLSVCDFGADHELFIAAVTAGQQLKEGSAFMHQRGNGFHY